MEAQADQRLLGAKVLLSLFLCCKVYDDDELFCSVRKQKLFFSKLYGQFRTPYIIGTTFFCLLSFDHVVRYGHFCVLQWQTSDIFEVDFI